jgi:thymidine kinase
MSGELQLIVGPMFAGKTTEMLRRLRRDRIAGKRVVVVKWAQDTRTDQVNTHAGDAWAGDRREVALLAQVDVNDYDVVGVDEGQFFADVVEVTERWANAGKIVVVAMLDGTYERKPFPGASLAGLLAHCETVVKLRAVCECHGKASFSQRRTGVPTTDAADRVQVAGAEVYRAVCRRCYAAQ